MDSSEPTISQTPDSSKKKQSPNWLPLEAEQLARSWIHVSESSKHARNQSGIQFYQKIKQEFNKKSKIMYRDWETIHTRWTSLNTATLKFAAIYQSIERSPPSGSGLADWMRAEKDVYAQQCKGQHFKLEAAWQVLKSHPKWMADGTTSLNPLMTSSSTKTGSSSSATTLIISCPEGVKASKRRCREETASTDNPEESVLVQQVLALKKCNEISQAQNKLGQKLYMLEQKKVQSDMMANQLLVIMQSEENCPDLASLQAL